MDLLIVPLTTALFALLGSYLGAKWGRTTEHRQWLRNERVKVYSDFLTEIQEEIRKAEWSMLEQPVAVKFPHVHMARIDVVGSEAVREAASDYARHIRGYETARSLLANEPRFLEISGPNTAKRREDFTQARVGLIDIGTSFVLVIREDLRTG